MAPGVPVAAALLAQLSPTVAQPPRIPLLLVVVVVMLPETGRLKLTRPPPPRVQAPRASVACWPPLAVTVMVEAPGLIVAALIGCVLPPALAVP